MILKHWVKNCNKTIIIIKKWLIEQNYIKKNYIIIMFSK